VSGWAVGRAGSDSAKALAARDTTGGQVVVVVEGPLGGNIAAAAENAVVVANGLGVAVEAGLIAAAAADSIAVAVAALSAADDNPSAVAAGSAKGFSAVAAALSIATDKRVFTAVMVAGMAMATPVRVAADGRGRVMGRMAAAAAAALLSAAISRQNCTVLRIQPSAPKAVGRAQERIRSGWLCDT
jgi:hypothetical protein